MLHSSRARSIPVCRHASFLASFAATIGLTGSISCVHGSPPVSVDRGSFSAIVAQTLSQLPLDTLCERHPYREVILDPTVHFTSRIGTDPSLQNASGRLEQAAMDELSHTVPLLRFDTLSMHPRRGPLVELILGRVGPFAASVALEESYTVLVRCPGLAGMGAVITSRWRPDRGWAVARIDYVER